jgi:hydrogenase nickel incorporation protein HypA/HybF
MHELSIATSIVAVARQEAALRGVQVEAVHLRLGVLAGVVVDSLLFGYQVASQGTDLEGTRLLIEEVPISIYCPDCQNEFELQGVQSLRCPQCQQLSDEVWRGRELEIIALEVR